MTNAAPRVVAVMTGGIGNMVLFTPALEALARSLPGARIDAVVANPGAWAVVAQAPFAGEAFTVRGLGSLPRLAVWLRRPRPRVLLVATGHHPRKGALLARLSGAPITVGEGLRGYRRRAPHPGRSHEVTANFALAALAGAEGPAPAPRVWLGPEDHFQAQGALAGLPTARPRLALHLGCGAALAYKRWSREGFREVAGRAVQAGAHLVVLGGPDETQEAQSFVAALPRGAATAVTGLPLRATAALLGQVAVLVTNDSGPMHLAAAVGTPCVAVFGPTDEAKFGPWGPGHRVVTAPTPCRPCYPDAHRCAHRACLTGVSPDAVWAAVRPHLDGDALRAGGSP